MSEWKKVKLGDLGRIVTGKTPPTKDKDNYGGEIPFITPVDMVGNRTIYETERYVSEKGKQAVYNCFLPTHTICVSCIGSDMGKSVVTSKPSITNQQINSIIVNNQYHWLFVFYLMRTLEVTIKSLGRNATAVPILNKSKFTEIEVSVPPLPTQHRIATILSRYDSLIENYQKQIKLLEEAAQRLYKEWFVDLHFPGHENTKIVDGVPEGWTSSLLGQLAEFKRGKTITKKDAVEGDIPVVAGGLEPAYYCNKSNTAERVITVSGSGANAGFTRIYFEKVWASDCSFVDATTTPFLHFVYCFLKDNKTTIDNLQKGAAQPHVYAKDINSLSICIPIESVLTSFEGKASKYFDTISSLLSQIRLLTEARDRLLPKLMNGELKV